MPVDRLNWIAEKLGHLGVRYKDHQRKLPYDEVYGYFLNLQIRRGLGISEQLYSLISLL